jgi:hypothetical protein
LTQAGLQRAPAGVLIAHGREPASDPPGEPRLLDFWPLRRIHVHAHIGQRQFELWIQLGVRRSPWLASAADLVELIDERR